jgi:hypothetical protein
LPVLSRYTFMNDHLISGFPWHYLESPREKFGVLLRSKASTSIRIRRNRVVYRIGMSSSA